MARQTSLRHRSNQTRNRHGWRCLAERKLRLRVRQYGERYLWFESISPKYAPELNDIEVVWHDLKAHHLAHQTFADADALDRAIHAAVAALNQERSINQLVNQRISA